MTTKAKLDSALSSNASVAIEDLIGRIYAKPGMRVLAVVELAHVERTQPAPDEDKDATVKLGIKHLEVARGGRQEEAVRRALNALYTIRTASGTLDPEGEVALSERTLGDTAGEVMLVTAARLQVAMRKWADYARNVLSGKLSNEQLRQELRDIAAGLDQSAEWSDGD